MKKYIITIWILFTMFFCFPIVAIASTSEFFDTVPDSLPKTIDDIDFSPRYLLCIYNGEIILEIGGKEINFQKKPYIKENIIMLPFRELIEQNGQSSEFVYNQNKKIVTITLEGKNVTFFEGQRKVIADGMERVLTVVPDITENDIFIGTDDLFIITNARGVTSLYSNNIRDIRGQSGCRTIEYAAWSNYHEKHLTGYLYYGFRILEIEIKGKTKIDEKKYSYYINEKEVKEAQTQSDWYEKNDYPPPYSQKDKYLIKGKLCNTYEKDGEIMIAVKDIEVLSEPKTSIHIFWDEKEQTALIKTYKTSPRYAVIKKDSDIMNLNGNDINMPVSVEIKNNRLYIPIKAVIEILNITKENIVWIEQGKELFITY